jgi:hypothetical protein
MNQMNRTAYTVERRLPLGWMLALASLAMLLLLAAAQVTATGQSSARSVAMGGAHIGLASGVDAARYNPANLGLASHRSTGIEFVGVGANVSNNAFTLADYNKYTGAFLTTEDKADILSKIPEDGLRLSADVEATAMAISAGPFAFNVIGVGVADVNLNRDIFELVLNGNTFADTISVDGSYSEAISYASAGLSFGMPVYTNGSRQLSVGVTGKYLRGLAIEQVIELQGMMATYATGYAGQGSLIAQTATGGSGYALDLGAALKLNNSYTAGIKMENVVSKLTWDKETEEHGYLFNFDTMTVDNMEDDYVVSDDYSRDIDAFETTLPSTMTVGIANTAGRLVWAVDYQQKFRTDNGTSTKPRLAVGAEWSPIGILPLRVGYATGGDRNAAFSFGSGLRLLAFYIDAAAVTGTTGSGYSSKGVHMAFSTGLQF